MQALAAAFAHGVDKLRVDLIEHVLRMFVHLRRFRRERVEKALVLTRGVQAALDPQLVHQTREAEAIHQHANRTDDARLVHVNLVGRRSRVIAARGTHVADHDIQRNRRILGAQPANLVVDNARLHRAAARAITAQNHACRTLVVERTFQCRVDIFRIRVRIGRDFAVKRHHCRVPPSGRNLVAGEIEGAPYRQQQDDQEHKAEEDLPAACRALFGDSGKRDALERCALPARLIGRRARAACQGRFLRFGSQIVGHAVQWKNRRGEKSGGGRAEFAVRQPEHRAAVR